MYPFGCVNVMGNQLQEALGCGLATLPFSHIFPHSLSLFSLDGNVLFHAFHFAFWDSIKARGLGILREKTLACSCWWCYSESSAMDGRSNWWRFRPATHVWLHFLALAFWRWLWYTEATLLCVVFPHPHFFPHLMVAIFGNVFGPGCRAGFVCRRSATKICQFIDWSYQQPSNLATRGLLPPGPPYSRQASSPHVIVSWVPNLFSGNIYFVWPLVGGWPPSIFFIYCRVLLGDQACVREH